MIFSFNGALQMKPMMMETCQVECIGWSGNTTSQVGIAMILIQLPIQMLKNYVTAHNDCNDISYNPNSAPSE